jgi:membrane-associated phospholipid phosphatase
MTMMPNSASENGRSLTAAAWTSALLSALFLVVYGGCNWLTAQRADVGTCYFEWERHIPFVPLLILPYMSIDLFFVAAPFLCRDRAERWLLARRIVFAIVIAGAFFLLVPLRFAFERPHTDGWLGIVFDAFRSLDQPYNLFPSLHIALRTILVDIYSRHTRGLVQAAVHFWFSLIGYSTVLTYQHHVLDVAGGFELGGLCLYLFHESAARLPVVRNVQVGSYYALASVAALGTAVLTWPWGSLLCWPALALGLVAAGYWGMGPGIFRKSEGRLSSAARFVLGPVLLGQYLSLQFYRRQCRAWDEVAPGVWIGRTLSKQEAEEALRQGVTAVLDLTAELNEAAPFRTVTYRNLPIMDLTAPTSEQLREVAAFIAEQAALGTVYVHCKAGYSRSGAAVAAYLLTTGQAGSVEEAVNRLRQARPSIVIRPEAMEALHSFESDHPGLLGPIRPAEMLESGVA